MRKAGVLMPVSALPSRIGAGELGESAFQFIELLKAVSYTHLTLPTT